MPGSFGIPADWRDLGCGVLLTSGIEDAVDRFALVEVAAVATRIMEECAPVSKTGVELGGIGLVGNRRGLIVAVNGPEPLGGGGGVVG